MKILSRTRCRLYTGAGRQFIIYLYSETSKYWTLSVTEISPLFGGVCYPEGLFCEKYVVCFLKKFGDVRCFEMSIKGCLTVYIDR